MTKRRFVFVFLFLTFSFLYAGDIIHVIRKGDTLYALSRKYNVTVDSILKKNHLSNASKIKIGQKILIPRKDAPKKYKTKTYKIKKGDSLFALAKKFGVNFSTLMKLNGLNDKSVIKIGQVIKIPQITVGKKKSSPSKTKTGKTTRKNTHKAGSHNSKALKAISSKKANSKLLWPVPAKNVFYLSGKIYGVVIDSKKGQSVKAIASGTVVSTGPHRGFGQVVFVRTKTKHIFVYGGLSKVSVKKGTKVKVGQKLGSLGTELLTGKARMYFMVYNKNKPMDPAKAPRGF